MRKETILFFCAVVVLSAPFLGVPQEWRDGILYTTGCILILLSLSCRIDARRRERVKEDVVHVEHNPHETSLSDDTVYDQENSHQT